MKIFCILSILVLYCETCFSQVFSTNRTPVGLESNLLFRADARFSVSTQNFPGNSVSYLFDGSFNPVYVYNAISPENPSVIDIENLPEAHVQAGAWIGWTTRYCQPKRFKIEGFENYYAHNWITIADYTNSDYNEYQFVIQVPPGSYIKLRMTIYPPCECSSIGISYGISELFFIHPEVTTPYSGLYEAAGDMWEKNNNNLAYESGNVLIGKSTQANNNYKLDIAGKIRAEEVVVNTTGADFVFAPDYKLLSLSEVEEFIKENNRLPDIQSSAEMQKNGMNMSEMQTKLLQKIEELTLYVIELKKENSEQNTEIMNLKKKFDHSQK